MNRQVWAALIVCSGLMAGGLLQRVFFKPPQTNLVLAKAADRWVLPGTEGVWTAGGNDIWESGRPLGAAPAPPPLPAPPAPPPPPTVVPAGIVVVGRNVLQAVFFDPMAGEVQLKRGDALPSGGRVVRIEPNLVEWTNSKGQRFRHVMLLDPAPFTTFSNGVAPGGFPVGPPPAPPPPINAGKP